MRIDEAAQLRNKADKLRAYAKQKKDHELHRWMGEIFCRGDYPVWRTVEGAQQGGA